MLQENPSRDESRGKTDGKSYGLHKLRHQWIAVCLSRVTGNWFDRTSEDLYFPQCQPIAPIFAEGVLKTLELSLNGKGDPVPSIPGGLSISQT
jgi:hypothetical protein